MNVDEIGHIAEIMKEYDLSEFSLESDDLKVKMRRGTAVLNGPIAMPMQAAPAAAPVAPQLAEKAVEVRAGETINSPIVGTFYNALAPDAPAFAKVGDRVDAETVVCIVEAMKVMNEIKAEKQGVIKRVLVENAMPVEFGQPMFELEVN